MPTYESSGYLDAYMEGVKTVLVQIFRDRQYDKAVVERGDAFTDVGLRFMVARGDKEFLLDVDRQTFHRELEKAEPGGPFSEYFMLFHHKLVLEQFRRAGREFVRQHVAPALPALPEPAPPKRPVRLVCERCQVMVVFKEPEPDPRCSTCNDPLVAPGSVALRG